MLFKAIFILGVGISPFIVYFWFRQQWESRALQDIQTAGSGVVFSHWQRPSLPPDVEYVDGIGYIIGDITCQYNARSSYIRCAVNPDGPCQDCRFYDSREYGTDS